jgi:hypothetical protein
MQRITLALPAPYVGLRYFSEKEALLFFGRDAHVRDLLTKLEGKQRFTAVLGASGSGKSSLVRAGLVPALHRGALASGGLNWNVRIFKPGDAPLRNLAWALTEDERWIDSDDRATSISALSALLAGSPLALTELYRQKSTLLAGQALLLVADQFEEIFRYRQKNTDEAEAFVKLLLRSASEEVPIYVVMTMRSDFLGNCAAFFGLPEAINCGIYLTPRLAPDQLKSVVASPLALVGGEIDPVLVNRLVNTLGGEDELPILEHALLRMWNRARAAGRTRIEVDDFEAICAPPQVGRAASDGSPSPPAQPLLAFAINNHASEIYDGLSPQCRLLARRLFLALVERRDGRDVRRPQTLQHLVEQAGEHERANVETVIESFRAEGAGFLLPAASEPLRDETVVDITHESLFRQWHLFQSWLAEEAADIAELLEWRQRAARRKEGGGWLDEGDCERALRWRARVNDRVNPSVWAVRYGGPASYSQVDDYLQASLDRLNTARAERERLEREAEEEKLKRLEAEARLQREAAERAEADRARAEEDRRKAEAFAEATRRRSLIAIGVGIVALLVGFVAVVFWFQASREKVRAEKMARDAFAGELVARAENLAMGYPDQSLLLGLAARRISAVAKADALIRAAGGSYAYRAVLRGHEGVVWSAQFSPDGKTVVTASWDKTSRLWQCEVCAPIEEIAAALARKVGRGLTAEERRRFGVPDESLLAK